MRFIFIITSLLCFTAFAATTTVATHPKPVANTPTHLKANSNSYTMSIAALTRDQMADSITAIAAQIKACAADSTCKLDESDWNQIMMESFQQQAKPFNGTVKIKFRCANNDNFTNEYHATNGKIIISTKGLNCAVMSEKPLCVSGKKNRFVKLSNTSKLYCVSGDATRLQQAQLMLNN